MSISTESTTNEGDITADQESWPPNFANLDPSEEMRLLSARIAQLKRQQTINSPTSSASFNSVAQKGKAKVGNADTLGDRNKIGESSHEQKQANIAEFVRYHEKMAKMELELKELKEEMKDMQQLKEEFEKLRTRFNALTEKVEGDSLLADPTDSELEDYDEDDYLPKNMKKSKPKGNSGLRRRIQ